LQKRDSILALYDDDAVEKVFATHKDPTTKTLKPEKLPDALKDLCVTGQDLSSKEPFTLDDFKRIARQPNEAEQWFQMIPFASLLSSTVGKTTLDEIEKLGTGEVDLGLQAFLRRLQVMVKERLEKLKDQLAKLGKVEVSDGGSKFGGVLEGGKVDDFHHGLSNRLGKYLNFSVFWRS